MRPVMIDLMRVYGLGNGSFSRKTVEMDHFLGTLFIVATPIGNLEDITLRALRVLREVSLIAAEDTRHTGKLLAHFEIKTPLISYHSFNERSRRESLLESLSAGDVALVTDAGTPGISDPGFELVDAALNAGFPVRSVPGASSLTAAVSVSGMLNGSFTFLGFLPRKGKERSLSLARSGASGAGLVLYESANRLVATLGDLHDVLGSRRYAVVRELSKIHEEIVRGDLGNPADIDRHEGARGEVVIVIAPGEASESVEDPLDVLRGMLDSGMKPSDAARETSTLTGVPRSELYQQAMAIKQLKRGDSES